MDGWVADLRELCVAFDERFGAKNNSKSQPGFQYIVSRHWRHFCFSKLFTVQIGRIHSPSIKESKNTVVATSYSCRLCEFIVVYEKSY
jgi:hypothetical protein